MPWKEPGEKPREPRGRESWGQGGHGPDLEAWLRRLRRGLGPFGRGPLGVLAVLVLACVLWFAVGGWVSIGPQQVGVVTRFGRLQAVLQPGLHLRLPPPIDRVRVVDMQRVRTLSDDVRMLTGDGQLALVDYLVEYKVSDARTWLFGTRDAEESVRNAATVAMRVVVGTHDLAGLMDRRDDALSNDLRARLSAAIARAGIGISVVNATIQNVGVPSEVKPAFDGITKAREDAKAAQAAATAEVARQKLDSKAQQAAITAAAAADRAKAEADAREDAARFGQLLAQYQASPQVLRHRLWLDTLHDVLGRNHVIINTGDGNVIVQFPPRQPAVNDTGKPAPATSTAPAPAASASATPPVTSGPTLRGGEA